MSQRSFADYVKTGTMLADHFGRSRRVDDLRPDDFEALRGKLAARLGPVSLTNEINRVRVVLKFASDQRLIPHPVSYRQSFNRPSAKMLRRNPNAAGARMFDAAELRTILDALDGKPVKVVPNCDCSASTCQMAGPLVPMRRRERLARSRDGTSAARNAGRENGASS